MNYICVRNLIGFSKKYNMLLEHLIGEVSGLVLYFTIPADIVFKFQCRSVFFVFRTHISEC